MSRTKTDWGMGVAVDIDSTSNKEKMAKHKSTMRRGYIGNVQDLNDSIGH